MPAAEPLSDHDIGIIARVEAPVGVGTISSGISTRIYSAPFVISDLDVDFVDGHVRVIGHVGLGTGADSLLFNVARFEAQIGLTLKNYTGGAFDADELSELFNVDVESISVDMLPGTDVDEWPLWVWLLIAVFAPGLAGTAAVIRAIEAVLRPIVSSRIESEVVAAIADNVKGQVRRQFNELVADMGIDLPEETKDEILDTLWFEGDTVSIDDDNVTITGWAGVWHDMLVFLEDGLCSFAAAATGQSGAKKKTTTMETFMQFKQALVKDGRLDEWSRKLQQVSPELLAITKKKPALVKQLIDVASKHAKLLSGSTTKVTATAVKDFRALLGATMAEASADLKDFLGKADKLMEKAAGKTVQQMVAVAKKQQSSLSKGKPQPAPIGVPAFRVGQKVKYPRSPGEQPRFLQVATQSGFRHVVLAAEKVQRSSKPVKPRKRGKSA
jgi:hypothetical protein